MFKNPIPTMHCKGFFFFYSPRPPQFCLKTWSWKDLYKCLTFHALSEQFPWLEQNEHNAYSLCGERGFIKQGYMLIFFITDIPCN